MKRQSIHISIPTPCHESWDAMDTTAEGAFCHSCQKEVIDFSAMTDREVIEYLAKHKTGCGRLRKDQLETSLTVTQVDNRFFKLRALLLGVLSFIAIKPIWASGKTKTPSDQYAHFKKDTSIIAIKPSLINVSGSVTAKSGKHLSKTQVVVWNLKDKKRPQLITLCTTDNKGRFSLNIDTLDMQESTLGLCLIDEHYSSPIIFLTNEPVQKYKIKAHHQEFYLGGMNVQIK